MHVEDPQSLVKLDKSPSFPDLSFVARSAYITSDRRANSSERNGVYRSRDSEKDVHPVELGRSTLRDLLDTKLAELSLQLIELLGEVVLALSPELSSLNLGARLILSKKTQVSTYRKSIDRENFASRKKRIGYIPFWLLRVVCREFVELRDWRWRARQSILG